MHNKSTVLNIYFLNFCCLVLLKLHYYWEIKVVVLRLCVCVSVCYTGC